MAYSLRIAEAAEDDIREAYLWYEEQQAAVGNAFAKQISNAVDSIKENPLTSTIRRCACVLAKLSAPAKKKPPPNGSGF